MAASGPAYIQMQAHTLTDRQADRRLDGQTNRYADIRQTHTNTNLRAHCYKYAENSSGLNIFQLCNSSFWLSSGVEI